MKALRLGSVYFDVDRMGAAIRDDVLDTEPLTTAEIEAVLGLLIAHADQLQRISSVP